METKVRFQATRKPIVEMWYRLKYVTCADASGGKWNENAGESSNSETDGQ